MKTIQVSFFMVCVVLSASCVCADVTGTHPNETGDTVIKNKTIWKNEKITVSGNIVVEGAKGALYLDRTDLRIKNTAATRYGVTVRQGGTLVVRNKSYVGAASPKHGTRITISEGGVLKAEDSTFEDIADFRLAGANGRESYLKNVVVNKAELIVAGGELITIVNSKFVRTQLWPSDLKFIFVGNKMIGKQTMPTYGPPYPGGQVYSHLLHSGPVLKNISFDHSYVSHAGFNLWGSTLHTYIGFCEMGQRSNMLLNALSNDVVVEHFEHLAYMGGCNYGGNNLVWRHHRGRGVSHCGGFGLVDNVVIEDIDGETLSAGLALKCRNFIVRRCRLVKKGRVNPRRKCIGLSVLPYENAILQAMPRPENGVFKNVSCTGFHTGVSLRDTRALRFVDVKLVDSKAKDIVLGGGAEDIIFINTKYDPAKVEINKEDVFRPYWYADILVKDEAGRPVSGAKVTVRNDADPSVAPLSRTGRPKAIFTTGADGHTPLPAGKDPALHRYSDYFTLKSNTDYRFGGWVRIKTPLNLGAYIFVYEYDADGKLVSGQPVWVRGESDWVRLEDKFTTRPETVKGRIMIEVIGREDKGGSAWFDDLFVAEAGKGERNLLGNPGFERDVKAPQGSPDGWDKIDGYTGRWDEQYVHSGKRSYNLNYHFWAKEDWETIVLCDYSRTRSGKVEYTYTVTAEKDGKRAVVKVNPDRSWYRENPTKPPVTIRVTLK